MAEVVTNPVKMDDLTVKKLEEAFSIGADVRAACCYANISHTTYYNWIKSFPEYEERFATLRDKPILKAYNTINRGLDQIETAKWYLERKVKEFKPKQDLTTDDNPFTPVMVKFIDDKGNNNSDTNRVSEAV